MSAVPNSTSAAMAAASVTASAAPQAAAIATPEAATSRRLRSWAGILSAYFGSQTITQLLGIAAGILFVRHMSVGEFALYTLGTSVITFVAFVTDLGSTTSLVHFYQRALKEGREFGSYLAAVLSLRRTAFGIAAVGVVVVLPLLAGSRGFDVLPIAMATAAVLLAVASQIVASVRVLVARLEGRYGESYRAELAGSAVRLLLAGTMVAAAWLQAWLALAVAAAGSGITAWLSRGGRRTRGTTAAELRRCRADILRYLMPTLPSALYFSVQAPLVVWLAATFGASQHIAEVGALGRLGLVVGIFSGLTSVVFVPRLARIVDERLWRQRAVQFGLVNAGIGAALVAGTVLVPAPFLWILGAKYSALTTELALVVAGASLTLVGGYLVALNMSRAWNRWQPGAMMVMALSQALLIASLRPDTTAAILLFNALSGLVGLTMQAVIAGVGMSRPHLVESR